MLNPTRVLEKALYFTTQTLQKTVPYADNNTFLNGIYAPVKQEVTVFDLQVEGEIPTVLNGILTRIGPNPMQVKNPAAYHWFLGDGMVHAVKLQAGRALWYRNRYIGVDSVQKTLKRPLLAGARHGIYDTVNTNVFGHAGKIYALVEAGACPVELDTELNSIKHGLFESPLNQGYTAHPHCDPQTGELHAICYDALALNVLRYVVIDPQGQVRRNLKIPVSGSPMVHDCAITQSSVIILDLPVGFSVQAAVKGGALPYCWRPKKRLALVYCHVRVRLTIFVGLKWMPVLVFILPMRLIWIMVTRLLTSWCMKKCLIAQPMALKPTAARSL